MREWKHSFSVLQTRLIISDKLKNSKNILVYPVSNPKQLCVARLSQNNHSSFLTWCILDFSFNCCQPSQLEGMEWFYRSCMMTLWGGHHGEHGIFMHTPQGLKGRGVGPIGATRVALVFSGKFCTVHSVPTVIHITIGTPITTTTKVATSTIVV